MDNNWHDWKRTYVWRTIYIQRRIFFHFFSSIIFFSTEEKPKKRNEKECHEGQRSWGQFVKVCAENTLFAERQRSQKGRFSEAIRKGLTFTNNWNGVIFAFHFYFFWRKYMSTVNGLFGMSLHVSRVLTRIFSWSTDNILCVIIICFMLKSSISSITSGEVSEVLEVLVSR